MPQTKRTTEKRRAKFLEELCKGWSITKASKTARIPRSIVYEWRNDDVLFARAMDEAIEAGSDLLEDEAKRRASSGTLKPVFQGGKQVGTIREYSDTLMIFLLKGRRPGKFRDNALVEHKGIPDPAPAVSIAITDPVEVIRAYRKLVEND